MVGHVQALRLRPLCLELADDIRAAHAWDGDVGEHEVDQSGVRTAHHERFQAVARVENMEAAPLKSKPGQPPYLLVALDEKHRLVSSGRFEVFRARRRRGCLIGHRRQPDGKRRAHTDCAGDADMSFALSDDTVDGRKT